LQKQSSQELEYKLLKYIEETNEPIGALNLKLALSKELHISQSTIGRKLSEMEFNGFLVKVGRKGRRVTEKGLDYLKQLKYQLKAYQESTSLVKTFDANSKKKLLEILVVRRALEREIVSLVIKNASKDEIDLLQAIIDRQRMDIESGGTGAKQDIEFHKTLAQLSCNSVLEHTLRLILSQDEFARFTSFIRCKLGGAITDHLAIINAIEERDVIKAQDALTNHIEKLIADVETYWRTLKS
jgi:DNA-binding FadR family transcriptional regulator